LPVVSDAVSLIGTEAAFRTFELQNGAGTRSTLFGVELSTGVVVTPVEWAGLSVPSLSGLLRVS